MNTFTIDSRNAIARLVMYVPPIVANKIEAEDIGPGEPFECHQTPPNAATLGCPLASCRCFVPTRAVTLSMRMQFAFVFPHE